MILISTAGMGYTAVGVGGDWPNWMQDVMFAVTVFCSIFSLSACIDKRLQFVFKKPAALGRVAQRSVVQAIARIIGLADILEISRLRQFQLTAFVEHLEEGFDLSSLKEYLTWDRSMKPPPV